MTELIGIARFRIHEGMFDEFERLSAEAMEIVRTKEPGTLQYDTYFDDALDDVVEAHRYVDAEGKIGNVVLTVVDG